MHTLCTYVCLCSHVINADPLDVVQTVPYSPAALGDETSLKKAPPRLSLWMSECHAPIHCVWSVQVNLFDMSDGQNQSTVSCTRTVCVLNSALWILVLLLQVQLCFFSITNILRYNFMQFLFFFYCKYNY